MMSAATRSVMGRENSYLLENKNRIVINLLIELITKKYFSK